MPDYPRAKPGDPLAVPAAAYNEFLDGAAERRRRRGVLGGAVAVADFDPAVILVKNTTGAALDRFAVVGLSGPAIDPAANPDGFQQAVMMLGRAPVLPDDAGRFAVLLSPLPDGQAGYAAISGACPVQVDVANAGDTFADVTAGVTDKLASGSSGQEILWKAAGTGVQWAVVRLGGGGAGPSVKFGVLTSTWAAGDNAVSLTPCKGPSDSTSTGEDPVAAHIQFPINKPAPAFDGQAGDILAYMTSGGISFLVGAPVLPAGTQKFQALINQAGPLQSDWRPDFVRARGA